MDVVRTPASSSIIQPCEYNSSPKTEHVQMFLGKSQELLRSTVSHYKNCIRVAADTPIIPQTSKNSKGDPLTTLTPTYLCLQCHHIVTSDGRAAHGKDSGHRFCRCTRDSFIGTETNSRRCRFQEWLPLLPDVR